MNESETGDDTDFGPHPKPRFETQRRLTDVWKFLRYG